MGKLKLFGKKFKKGVSSASSEIRKAYDVSKPYASSVWSGTKGTYKVIRKDIKGMRGTVDKSKTAKKIKKIRKRAGHMSAAFERRMLG